MFSRHGFNVTHLVSTVNLLSMCSQVRVDEANERVVKLHAYSNAAFVALKSSTAIQMDQQ